MRAKLEMVYPYHIRKTPDTLESELRKCKVVLCDARVVAIDFDKYSWKVHTSDGNFYCFQKWSPLAELLSAYTANVAITPEDKKDIQEALNLYADVLSPDYLESLRTFIARCEGVEEKDSVPKVYIPDIKVTTVKSAVLPYPELCNIIGAALAQAGFSQYATWRFIYDDTGEELVKANIAIKVREEVRADGERNYGKS